MKENKWLSLERISSLITFVLLAYFVWNSLLRIEEKQAQQGKTLDEVISKYLQDPEQWQRVKEHLRD